MKTFWGYIVLWEIIEHMKFVTMQRIDSFRRRIAMTLKCIIIISFDKGFPTNTDGWYNNAYIISGYDCGNRNGYFDPPGHDCDWIIVHDGFRNWYAGVE